MSKYKLKLTYPYQSVFYYKQSVGSQLGGVP